MTFEDLKQCPYCQCEEFFTKDYMHGSSWYYQRFDGNEANDNSQMYDGLITEYGARCYCANCGKYLGNRFSNKLSANVKKVLESEVNAE